MPDGYVIFALKLGQMMLALSKLTDQRLPINEQTFSLLFRLPRHW
jgi:hypothetical protein